MLPIALEIKLNQIGQQLVDRLVSDIKTKQLTKYGTVNASGDLAGSVRYEVNDNGLTVYALDYIYYLVHGRKPGKFPPKEPILRWIRSKPGIGSADISDESLAFLIQRKISRQGTTIFEQGGSDLISGILESDFFDNITKELAQELLTDISSDIIQSLAA